MTLENLIEESKATADFLDVQLIGFGKNKLNSAILCDNCECITCYDCTNCSLCDNCECVTCY